MTAHAQSASTLPRGARGGLTPFYIAAALGFAFTLSFAGDGDPMAARVALALGAASVGISMILLGHVVLTLRGKKRYPFLEELPTHEALGEEKKRLLAALKEIEFDHEMNKINDRDYGDLRARYEAEALKVLKALDEERDLWRAKAEKVADAHLTKLGLKPGGAKGAAPAKGKKKAAAKELVHKQVARPEPATGAQAKDEAPVCACGVANDPDARFCKSCGADLAAPAGACPGCGTANDPDARFCKHCGGGLEAKSA